MSTGGIFILQTNSDSEKFSIPETKVSADEVIPGLWIGNEEASQSRDFLKKANISAIVNATKYIPNKYPLEIDYYQISINDPGFIPFNNLYDFDQEDNMIMLKNLPFVVDFIHKHLQQKQNVLVHCRAGIQRSATVVLAYLITYVYRCGTKRERLRKSLRRLLESRPISFYGGKKINFGPAIGRYIIDL